MRKESIKTFKFLLSKIKLSYLLLTNQTIPITYYNFHFFYLNCMFYYKIF